MFPSPNLPDVSEERMCVYAAWQQVNAGILNLQEFADIAERPQVFTQRYQQRIDALLAQCGDDDDENAE